MNKSASEKIKLGMFVIIGLVFIAIASYLIGNKQNLFEKTFKIYAVFNNVNGLRLGNNVRYSGINTGNVNNIEMLNDSTIIVTMTIEQEMIKHIKKNAVAAIGSDGLVGNMIINIIPGEGKSTAIAPRDTIRSYNKVRTDDILNTLSVTNENAATLTADLLKITNSIVEGKGTIGILLNDTIMAADLKQTITNLKVTSKEAAYSINTLNKIIASVDYKETVAGVLLSDTVSGKQIKSLITNLHSSSEGITIATENLNTILKNIEEGEGAINYLANDPIFVQRLDSTMKNINEGSKRFNENMEALKHNFLFRGYFRRLEKKNKKE
ncbi:MlaD family protein [Leptobacterium sp. I13]|uniref:MlaD family protein n=1 Tax=Leptobacterium meishanense TaxID=3128904 RepID=UPI0030ECE845